MNKVLVIGSINMDLTVQAERFPLPGETIIGQCFTTCPGGKGANQAVAASRLGASVRLIGCVGSDAFGTALINGLKRENIGTDHIRISDKAATGVASITVCDSENSIVVAPGANGVLSPADIHAAESAFAWADVVLAQLEIPLDTVEAAADLACRYARPFLLNPAPAIALPASLLDQLALLIPNEHELAIACNAEQTPWQDILGLYPGRIIMTQGAAGAWFSDAFTGQIQHQPGFTVRPVDTTGAGDTFNGAMAAFWGKDMAESVTLACAAAALSVTRHGAQGGMPNLAQLQRFLAENHQP